MDEDERELKPVRRLPAWAWIADIVVLLLLALAGWVAVAGGFSLTVAGARITVHSVARLLVEAAAVLLARHFFVRHPPIHHHLRPARFRVSAPALLAVGLPGLVYLGVLLHGYDGGPYLRGDCADYYRTARSLLEDGDLDISNQFPPPLAETWSGVSVAVDGRLVPKHPIPMPVASLPFIAAFGAPGALVFNLLQIGCLLAVLYHLGKRWSTAWASAAAVALTGVATFLPHYVWNYSPDVFAALLLAAALVPLTSPASTGTVGRYILGGVLAGLAVMAKQTLVVFLPTTFLFCRRPFDRTVPALALGLTISLGAFGLHNARLFGSPLVTAYDRIAVREGSGIGVFSHRRSFTVPIADGARGQLLDPQHGLIPTSAVTLVSLAGLAALATVNRAAAVHIGLGSVVLFFLMSMYDQWNASHYGNRFLLPIVALGAIPLAALVDATGRKLIARWPSRSTVRHAGERAGA